MEALKQVLEKHEKTETFHVSAAILDFGNYGNHEKCQIWS
jgi:hypothetical protein